MVRAVARALEPRCPNAPPRWVMNLRTQKAHRLSCGRWSCRVCGCVKRQAAKLAVEQGIRAALGRGEWVRLMTLTEDPDRPLDLPALGASWNRLRTALKDAGLLAEYVAVVETTKAGRLHLHVVATGKYIPVRALRQAASAAGFGKVTDVRALGGKSTPTNSLKREELVSRAAHYVAKYLSDESKRRDALEAHVRERLRPVRFSRGWGASLGSAKADLIAQWRDERGEQPPERHPDDEWLSITRTARGGLRVFRRGEQIDPGDVDLLAAGITPANYLPRPSTPLAPPPPTTPSRRRTSVASPARLFELPPRREHTKSVRHPRRRARR